MVSIVFVDGTCPHPYTAKTLEQDDCRLGGAEIALVSLAAGFSEHKVTVLQYGRQKREICDGIEYREITDVEGLPADVVILLRLPDGLPVVRGQWPEAKLVLWLHDQHDESLSKCREVIIESRAKVVVGSKYHKERLGEFLGKDVELEVIYLPVSDSLQPLGIHVNPRKLTFASSPSRGLGSVLALFAKARLHIEGLELFVFNPSYRTQDFPTQRGVHFFGRVTQAVLWKHLGESLCLFFPQIEEPESFGYVFAESHALGTPVLAHPFGSAPELLREEELVDGRDESAVLARLEKWVEGERPEVSALPEYRKNYVVKRWNELLQL